MGLGSRSLSSRLQRERTLLSGHEDGALLRGGQCPEKKKAVGRGREGGFEGFTCKGFGLMMVDVFCPGFSGWQLGFRASALGFRLGLAGALSGLV